nr:hypothetical protein [Pirellula staleyi]
MAKSRAEHRRGSSGASARGELAPVLRAKSVFDFTAAIRSVCIEAVAVTPELSHVDFSRIAVTFSQARSTSKWGLYASLTPLRFEGGSAVGVRRGKKLRIQRVVSPAGVEMLYILTFCLPRFMNLDFREKLITIFHELWHISPKFDGDIRRHEGRCYAHSSSQAAYDFEMGKLADRWMTRGIDPALVGFLEGNFNSLATNFGRVVGMKCPRPRLLPADR